jgi:hypothetical protein
VLSGTGAPVALVKRSGFDIIMLFWLSSTAAPEFVVNVGAGVCSLAIFINWLVLIFYDSTDKPVSVQSGGVA